MYVVQYILLKILCTVYVAQYYLLYRARDLKVSARVVIPYPISITSICKDGLHEVALVSFPHTLQVKKCFYLLMSNLRQTEKLTDVDS